MKITDFHIVCHIRRRSQKVSVNGVHSSAIPVTSGVPQGSVMGTVLFLLYNNDIKDNIRSPLKLFADDSIVYQDQDLE